ncbi:cilia- and flagella-associated protein 263-like [Oscarella lobularis]|uniref:cilia- and flagella-associated protein 263-like n=1 Tax=Oscarella lobularis TaxID=121494 RepID=UPI0033131ACA
MTDANPIDSAPPAAPEMTGEGLFHDWSNEALVMALEEVRQHNDGLYRETDMLEKYLKRVEPKETPTARRSSVAQDSKVRRKSRSQVEKLLRLTTEQKCDIATRELEELRDEIDKMTEKCEQILDSHRAALEEADIRLAEMKKASYEFERDILRGAINHRTGKVSAERVARYIEDKLRSRDALMEKLRLKNSTLKVQKKKLQLQLKQKEEMGEVLHEVDFRQLQIENKQYQSKIEERNQELLRLKLKAGNAQQVLNSYKKKLHVITAESTHLNGEIKQRHDLLDRIAIETEVVEKDRGVAEHIYSQLKRQLADFRVPDVLDYVGERAKLYDILKTVKSWERKVEIAQMALTTHKKRWKQMQMQSHQLNPWNALQGIPL